MLCKEMRAPLLEEILYECYGVEFDETDGASDEFSRANLATFDTVQKLRAYLWTLQHTFGLTKCPQLKRGVQTTGDAIVLLRQMIKATQTYDLEHHRQGQQFVFVDTDGSLLASRQTYRVVRLSL